MARDPDEPEDRTVRGRVSIRRERSLRVAFAYGGGLYQLPSWQGLIDGLVFDTARTHMRFEMRRDDGYGPVVFELWRCP